MVQLCCKVSSAMFEFSNLVPNVNGCATLSASEIEFTNLDLI